MSNIDTHRIAERFSGLSAKQRRVVYDKIRTRGLGFGSSQFFLALHHNRKIARPPMPSFANGFSGAWILRAALTISLAL